MSDSIPIPSIPKRPARKEKKESTEGLDESVSKVESFLEEFNVNKTQPKAGETVNVDTDNEERVAEPELKRGEPIVPQRPSRASNSPSVAPEPIIPARPRKSKAEDLPPQVSHEAEEVDAIDDLSAIDKEASIEAPVDSQVNDEVHPESVDENIDHDDKEGGEAESPVLVDNVPPEESAAPISDQLEEESEPIAEEKSKPEVIVPTIPTRPKISTHNSATSSNSIPQIPKRPSKERSSTATPKTEGEVPAESHIEASSRLVSEIQKEGEPEVDADGDKTPGNTDTKVSFKSFDEERPASDTSSFNDDVETVLQEKEESEPIAPIDTQATPIKIEDETPATEKALQEGDAQETHEVAEKPESPKNPTPIIPRRPPRPDVKKIETEHNASPTSASASPSDVPSKPKAPPPKPKKLSSKIAAFQEMFQKAPSPVAPSAASSKSESNPSIPKRPSKLSSDKAKFAQGLQGMIGRGIALPGMADPSLLEKSSNKDSGNDESEPAAEKPSQASSDVRKGRAKGPKGKRLPKSIKETTVEATSRFNLVVDDLWEVSHVKKISAPPSIQSSLPEEDAVFENDDADKIAVHDGGEVSKEIFEQEEEKVDDISGTHDEALVESKSVINDELSHESIGENESASAIPIVNSTVGEDKEVHGHEDQSERETDLEPELEENSEPIKVPVSYPSVDSTELHADIHQTPEDAEPPLDEPVNNAERKIPVNPEEVHDAIPGLEVKQEEESIPFHANKDEGAEED